MDISRSGPLNRATDSASVLEDLSVMEDWKKTSETLAPGETIELDIHLQSTASLSKPIVSADVSRDVLDVLNKPATGETGPLVKVASINDGSLVVQDGQHSTSLSQMDTHERLFQRVSMQGLPSWLSSLIFHLSLILLLAILTIRGNGNSVLELLGASTVALEIEPHGVVDIVLEPLDLETCKGDTKSDEPQMVAQADLSSLLDPLLTSTPIEMGMSSDLEKWATPISGLTQEAVRTPDGRAQFFGIRGEGTNFVFVIDCSGSMNEYGRWTQAIRELQQSIKQLKSDQKFLILLYNDRVEAMNGKAELVFARQPEQQRAFTWLSRRIPNSWTYCASALSTALSLQPDSIYLLSDGEFNDRQRVFHVLETQNAGGTDRPSRRQIPIHTIALGSHHGRFTMKRIADENQGLFRLVE